MAGNPNLVLADVLPYLGRTANALAIIEIGLLKQILLAMDPNAMTDPSEILEEMRCYSCLSESQLNLISINLLSQIAENQITAAIEVFSEADGLFVGGVPTVVPSGDAAICIDNSGALWTYYNGAWH